MCHIPQRWNTGASERCYWFQEIYIQDSTLRPVVLWSIFLVNSNWIVQDDNAQVHCSRNGKINENCRNDVATQSLDLIIPENAWRMIKIHLQREMCSIKAHRLNPRRKNWSKLSLPHTRSFNASIPRRLHSVIKAKAFSKKILITVNLYKFLKCVNLIIIRLNFAVWHTAVLRGSHGPCSPRRELCPLWST